MFRSTHARHARRSYLPPSTAIVCIVLGLYFAVLCALVHALYLQLVYTEYGLH